LAGYNLQPGEAFVLKADSVLHGGLLAAYTDELILTNQNLVLVKRGVFNNNKGTQVFPLHQVKVFQGHAQAFPGKQPNGSAALDVYFQHGTEQFGFGSQTVVTFWSQKIDEAITGAPVTMISPDASGAEKVAAAVKDTVGVFKDAFGFKSKAEAAAAAAVPVTGRCSSCGAPVHGFQGQAVICSYCSTSSPL
jgi:hypothetical protein